MEEVSGAGCRDWERDAGLSLGSLTAPGRVWSLVAVGRGGASESLVIAGGGHAVCGRGLNERSYKLRCQRREWRRVFPVVKTARDDSVVIRECCR